MSEQLNVNGNLDGLQDFSTWYRGEFQTPFPPKHPYLNGRIAARILDTGIAPNTIIKVGDDWYVDLYWSLCGKLQSLICGKWCIRLHLESMGKGKEFDFPLDGHGIEKKVDPCGHGYYHLRVKVPAGTIKAKHCGIHYTLVVSVGFHDYCGQPAEISGFVTVPMLQFIQGGNQHHHHSLDQGLEEFILANNPD